MKYFAKICIENYPFFPFRNDVQQVFIKTYYPTHIRLVPWLFGGAFAYFMNKVQGERRQKWSIVGVIITQINKLLLNDSENFIIGSSGHPLACEWYSNCQSRLVFI